MKNNVLETIKEREKMYATLTEKAIKIFINELRDAMQQALFDGNTTELFINNVGILPQNFRFCRVEGKISPHDLGDKIELETGEIVEIGLENFWDYSELFTVIVPFSLLDEPDVEQLIEYFQKVKENDGEIPMDTKLRHNKEIENDSDKNIVGELNLDDTQKALLKTLKNTSLH